MKNRKLLTPESFKATFKTGDWIEGFGTCLIFKITAIGDKKFLYLDGNGQERVAKMLNLFARWRIPNVSFVPTETAPSSTPLSSSSDKPNIAPGDPSLPQGNV